jgi:hypothetical protein
VRRFRGAPIRTFDEVRMFVFFGAAMVLSIVTWLAAMRSGVRALEQMSD